ncbi:MAG: fluoride efflux transporter CrcB [Clostridium sp.]|uniref:fluoride efflux transporter CrcB n=1 Tax=Clostridium sp. TaxID=1506 RepID=UPI003F403431
MQRVFLVILVGCGGFIGASLRYLISLGAKGIGTSFPFGTLIANILGALIIGFVMQLSLDTALISANTRLFLTTGMMGGLTTFSTFSYETIGLLTTGQSGLGIVNIIVNLALSLLGVVIGMAIARAMV